MGTSRFAKGTRSHEWLDRCDSVADRLAWIGGSWPTSDCVFKHSATVNQKRVCSSLCDRRQNDEILPNSSNYSFKWAIQSLRLATDCQILNMFKVNGWLLWLRNSVCDQQLCVHTSNCVADVPSAMESQRCSCLCEWVIKRLKFWILC